MRFPLRDSSAARHIDGNGPEDWVLVVNRLEEGLVGARALSLSVAARGLVLCKAAGGSFLRPWVLLFSGWLLGFKSRGAGGGGALRQFATIVIDDCLLRSWGCGCICHSIPEI